MSSLMHLGMCVGLALGLLATLPLPAQDAAPDPQSSSPSTLGPGPDPPPADADSAGVAGGAALAPAVAPPGDDAAAPDGPAPPPGSLDPPALAAAEPSADPAPPTPSSQPQAPDEQAAAAPPAPGSDAPTAPPPGGSASLGSMPAPDLAVADAAVLESRLPPRVARPEVDAFYDLNLGLGVVILSDFDEGRVESASVRKGKIRVDEADPVRLGVMLEMHRMFRLFEDDDRFGHGPYVGLIAGEDVVDAASLGWMLAMRRRDSSQSMNLSLGLFLDPDAKVLADDFQEGDSYKTDGQVLYKEEPMWGWVLGASFGF